MANTHSTIGSFSGSIGNEVHYTRFGKSFVRRKVKKINDRQSEAQRRQRMLFKTYQHTAALFGSVLQHGLTKYAHSHGRTEANEFTHINKHNFVYDDGAVLVNYPALQLAIGPLPGVFFTPGRSEGLQVELLFDANLAAEASSPDDVVHIYAVEPHVEVCQLMASVERQTGRVAFTLPDLSAETDKAKTFYLYAIVEAANTACIPTLSAAEKQIDKQHRNINRRVSNSIFIGKITE